MPKTKDTASANDGIMAKGKKKSQSRAAKAGLQFPVSKINRHLRESGRSKRVGAGAPVYMAAVLEYAAAEVLELASQQLDGGKRKRVTPQDVMKAVRNDDELNQLLSGASVFVGDRVKDVTKAVTYVPKKKGGEDA